MTYFVLNKKIFIVVFLVAPFLFFSEIVFGQKKKTTVLADVVSDCFQQQKDLPNFRKISEVYKYFETKFTLIRSQLIEKEVSYKIGDEERKLKYSDGKISLYRINKEKDGQVELIPNDVRQRSLTIESYISQLLLRAQVTNEWSVRTEQRLGGWDFDITEKDKNISRLIIKNLQNKVTLDCQNIKNLDSCKCQK